jgi:NTE family protein
MADGPRREGKVVSPKKINLALQGGGAHGAFTWGVLDCLLRSDEIEIAGISGTSAGALNGAALKAGMISGGREGALANLDWLWEQVAGISDLSLTKWMAPFGIGALSQMLEYSPAAVAGDFLSQAISPYAYGPFYRNPLTDIVTRFNYDSVCSGEAPLLYVCATRVRNGKIRIFKGNEIGPEALMASACLPTTFQSVEMFDETTGRQEAFWDGGYSGNPALFPLFDRALPDDIVVININPLERDEVPMTPRQIENRVNEISFNSSLLRELRAIEFVQRLIADGSVEEGRLRNINVHMIADDALMAKLSVTTKTMPNPAVIGALKEAGQAAAAHFLATHLKDVGKRSSVDLPAMFG